MEELETLKEIRSRYGSLRDISKQAGVSKSVLSLWERGEAPISLKGARALCEIFDDVGPYYLSSIQRIRYVVIQYEKMRQVEKNGDEENKQTQEELQEKLDFERTDLQLMKFQTQIMEVKPTKENLSSEIEDLRFGLFGFLQKVSNAIICGELQNSLPIINIQAGLNYFEKYDFDISDDYKNSDFTVLLESHNINL